MTFNVYRYVSLVMSITFSVVGLLFLFMSTDVLIFFNRFSEAFGIQRASLGGEHFYVALAVAYMYIVALLALQMYRNPDNLVFPFLLINAKIASAAVSFLVCFIDKPLLIYLTNGVVDAAIGIFVIVMYRNMKWLSS